MKPSPQAASIAAAVSPVSLLFANESIAFAVCFFSKLSKAVRDLSLGMTAEGCKQLSRRHRGGDTHLFCKRSSLLAQIV